MVVPPTPSAEAPLDTAKAKRRVALRRARREYVAALPIAERRALEVALWARVATRCVGMVASYVAVGAEINPAGIPATLLPWFAGAAAPMRWRAGPPRETGPHGIRQPQASDAEGVPGTVLVPLIAADMACNRLGQGGGHYDRALAELRARGSLLAIGLAWDMQVVDALKADPWDQPLDAIATPTRWIAP